MSEPMHLGAGSDGDAAAGNYAPPRADPPVSRDALTAVAFAGLLLVALVVDAMILGKGKHVICDRWLAKGQADCAGGDGFRQWAPLVVREGLILLAIELVLLPAMAYVIGLLLRSALARRTTAASH